MFDWKFGWISPSPPERSLAAQTFVWRDVVRNLNQSGRLGSRLRNDVPMMGPGSICARFACQCSANHAIRPGQRARCYHEQKMARNMLATLLSRGRNGRHKVPCLQQGPADAERLVRGLDRRFPARAAQRGAVHELVKYSC